MSKWFEIIIDELYEEQAVNKIISVDSIKERFYNNLIEQFMCSLSTLLFKFLINKCAGQIVEPHSLLINPPSDTNWAVKQKEWEKFVQE